ncbi:MAG: hypothetical protein ACYSWW_08280 [Planctomycetota bacterium]|jgi:hypothetical protein
MIKVRTVLVLGAGASAPFGFPTGKGLTDQISSPDFNNTKGPLDVLKDIGFDTKDIGDFVNALSMSGRPSVDAFLEYRDDFVEIGKATIAALLLPIEKTKRVFQPWRWNKQTVHDGQAKEANWYELLFGVLCDGIPFDEVDKNMLSVITFNYDRSLEQYLFIALKNSYNKSDEECAEKLAKFPIVHVHGSLGQLPWQSGIADSSPSVPYDSEGRAVYVRRGTENIRIIPEATRDTEEFIQARDLISKASRLLFLGFGYHPTNLARLVPELVSIVPKYVMGTSLGLSYGRKQAVEQWNEHLNERAGSLIAKDVYSFLHDHVSFSEVQ